MNLPKEAKDLYSANYNIIMKEISEIYSLKKWRVLCRDWLMYKQSIYASKAVTNLKEEKNNLFPITITSKKHL